MANYMQCLVQIMEVDNEAFNLFRNQKKMEMGSEDVTKARKKLQTDISKIEILQKSLDVDIAKYNTENELAKVEIVSKDKRLSDIRTNEEYQAVLKEIEHLKKRIAEREENIVTAKTQQTENQKSIEKFISDLNNLESKEKQDKDNLASEIDSIEKKLESIAKTRDELLIGLPTEIANTYKRIKTKRSNLPAIAQVMENGGCSNCRMIIPPQVVNLVISGDLTKLCNSCSCILTYVAPEKK